MNKVAEAYDRIYEDGAYQEFMRNSHWEPIWREWCEQASQGYGEHNDVLSLGCGVGRDLDYFAERYFDLHGCDLSSVAIDECNERFKNNRTNFIVNDIQDIELTDSYYEVIICAFSLFHLPAEKHFDILKKVNNALVDNGKFLVVMGSTDRVTPYSIDFLGEELPYSHFHWNENFNLISMAGFKILRHQLYEEPLESGGTIEFQFILGEKASPYSETVGV